MKQIIMLYSLIFLISILAACSYNPNEETSKINVNCQIKDTVSLNEPINLNASLTYDDQPREEAEIIFEVWESGNKNNSKMLQAENLGDGNYTHDYTFEKAGIYEIAAHSNIKEIDPLPQKEIVVTQANTNKENFDLQFIKPKNIVINEKTTLETHVTNDSEPLRDLDVRYEIAFAKEPDQKEWIHTKETIPGEYSVKYAFLEKGDYIITIHVEINDDFKEHSEYEITVN